MSEINNKELERFMEANPDASFKDVVDYFRDRINEELNDFIREDARDKMYPDFDLNFESRILGTLEDTKRMTQRRQELEDIIYSQYSNLKKLVEEKLQEHGTQFGNKLKDFTEKQLDTLIGMELKDDEKIHIRNGEIEKDEQDEEDRDDARKLEDKTQDLKQDILKAFKTIEIDPDKIMEMEYVLRLSDDVLQDNMFRQYKDQNDRIFEEYSMIKEKYMESIEEAAHYFAREEKETKKEPEERTEEKDGREQVDEREQEKPLEKGKSGIEDVLESTIRKEEVSKATITMKKEKEQEKEGEKKSFKPLSIDDIY